MKLHKLLLMIVAISSLFVFTQCERDELLLGDMSQEAADELLNKPADVGGDESVGNCLSFPVIWSDGATKVLRGTLGTAPVLDGEWYYVWGTDPIDPADMVNLKSAGPFTGENGELPDDHTVPYYTSYVQKDENNVWQAYNEDDSQNTTEVDIIDWGDNLESIDWNLKSRVRTEIVLYKILDEVKTQYAMRHCAGWGIDEVHGLQPDDASNPVEVPSDDTEATGELATIFTDNARLTIQKFIALDTVGALNNIYWDAGDNIWKNHSTQNEIIDEEAVINMAVHEAADGPGYYNAEVNVKGKLIYGYTWNVKKDNKREGYYRITFSFDDDNSNTYTPLTTEFSSDVQFWEDYTNIEPDEGDIEDDEDGDSGEPSKGGTPKMGPDGKVTYMDILITK